VLNNPEFSREIFEKSPHTTCN